VSIDTIEKQNLDGKNAFICNSIAHWIAIRKIRNVWYNLNSLGMRLPEIISDFYLSAFLMSVKQYGYQIFSVEGTFAETNEHMFEQYNAHQRWYPAKRIQRYQQKKMKRVGYTPNIEGAGIGQHSWKTGKRYVSSGEDSDWENDKKYEATMHFSGKGILASESCSVPYDKFAIDPEDVEYIEACRMSIEEKLNEKVTDGVEVIFRFPNGKKLNRRFNKLEPISTLYDFVWFNKSSQ
jgi:ataxin-3